MKKPQEKTKGLKFVQFLQQQERSTKDDLHRVLQPFGALGSGRVVGWGSGPLGLCEGVHFFQEADRDLATKTFLGVLVKAGSKYSKIVLSL